MRFMDTAFSGTGRIVSIGFTLLVIYVAGIALFDEGIQRGGAIGLGAVIILLSHPLARQYPNTSSALRAGLWLIDLVLLVGFLVCIRLFLSVYEDLWDGVRIFEPHEIAIATFGVVVILELTRRTMGPVLSIICVIALAYGMLGPHLPWILRHGGAGVDELMGAIWYSFDGVFGLPTDIVSRIVLIFIVFGAVLEATGASAVLIRVAVWATWRIRGGSAHAAIVASALFGTISGSTVANVVGTGVFTIPMIKRQGFPNSFAGAVEAAASSGGQFTPPVMAAVVFLMSELIGVPYLTICAAAALAAVFYYMSLFATVYTEAVRRGIKPLPISERPKLTRDDLIKSTGFIVPIIVLVVVLFAGRSAAMAGFIGLIAALTSGLLVNRDLRGNPGRLVDMLAEAGKRCGQIMMAVGAIGIVIAVVNTTGVGIRFASMISEVGQGSAWLALLVTALACLVLGMGLPTLPAYLIIVLVMGPAITKLGVNELLVHLFVLYYGVLSNITPPVAIAAYAAAPIAGANPMATGFQAIRIAAVGFIIPFVLIYNPAISFVVDFEWGAFIWAVLRVPVAIWLIATGTTGCEVDRFGLPERAARTACGFLVLLPITAVEVAALVIGITLVVRHRFLAARRGVTGEI
jgi:TRAP transporter 4TM/12TM fusion protein